MRFSRNRLWKKIFLFFQFKEWPESNEEFSKWISSSNWTPEWINNEWFKHQISTPFNSNNNNNIRKKNTSAEFIYIYSWVFLRVMMMIRILLKTYVCACASPSLFFFSLSLRVWVWLFVLFKRILFNFRFLLRFHHFNNRFLFVLLFLSSIYILVLFCIFNLTRQMSKKRHKRRDNNYFINI